MGDLFSNFSRELTYQNPYNVQAPLSQAEFRQMAQTGAQTLAQTQAGQQQLAQALLAQSQGQGPDIAGEALRQATGQNIAQQAGFMASQKGVNPAQAARLAAQAGAQMQQGAAGQAAMMKAQQQMQAQQSLGGLYGQMAQTGLGTVTGATESAMAPERIRAAQAAQNAAATQGTQAGLLGGVAAGIGKFLGFAEGGSVSRADQQIADQITAMSGMPHYGSGVVMGNQMQEAGGKMGEFLREKYIPQVAMASGGFAPEYASLAKLYHNYEMPSVSHLKATGGPVPGRAMVSGDSAQNDVVPTMLSPGEIVLPRSVVQSKNPVEASADFVAEELKKNKKYDGGTIDAEDDFKEALKKAISARKVKK